MSTIRAFAGVFAVVVSGLGCAASAEVVEEQGTSVESAAKIDCSYVKCALPLCAEGQHLQQGNGQCCPVCVGKPDNSKCATVLCAAVMCPEGQQRVYSPGDCCGHCVGKPETSRCNTVDDCPAFACITCPCPISECQGGQCVTSTPDATTCGAL